MPPPGYMTSCSAGHGSLPTLISHAREPTPRWHCRSFVLARPACETALSSRSLDEIPLGFSFSRTVVQAPRCSRVDGDGRLLRGAVPIGRAEDDSLLRNGRGHDAALIAYDPLPAARQVCMPVLIVHGATDLQVPAEDAHRLAAALRETGNRGVTVYVIPDVDHVLLADRSGDWRRYIALPSLIAPASARGLIADWLVTRLGLPALPPQHQGCPRDP